MDQDFVIFILDDDELMGQTIGIVLEENGFVNFKIFTDPDELLKSLNKDVRICIVDYRLNDKMDGFDVMNEVSKVNPHCYFIMISGMKSYEVIEKFCNAYMRGAFATKPGYGENMKSMEDKIIKFVHKIIEDMKATKLFYDQWDVMKGDINEIKNIIGGGNVA